MSLRVSGFVQYVCVFSDAKTQTYLRSFITRFKSDVSTDNIFLPQRKWKTHI